MKVTTAEILDLDPVALDPNEFCDRLFGYFADAGRSSYEEAVTQLEHGVQCAALAEAAGYDAGVQLAALFHDLGHLLLGELDDEIAEDDRHEVLGARVITRWFGSEVGGPIALHVAAKRYLVAVEPDYAAQLSRASAHSLEVQGGPMTPVEVERFRRSPRYEIAVELRRWDDLGKVPGADVPALEHWRPAIIATLERAHPRN